MPTTYRSPRIRSVWTGIFCFGCLAVIQNQLIQEESCAIAGLEIVSLEEDVDQTEVRELHRKIIAGNNNPYKILLCGSGSSSDAAENTTLSGFKHCIEPLVYSVKHSWSTEEEKCRLVETIQECFSPIWTRCLKDPSDAGLALTSDSHNSKISRAYSNVQNRTDGPDHGINSGSVHGSRCKVNA